MTTPTSMSQGDFDSYALMGSMEVEDSGTPLASAIESLRSIAASAREEGKRRYAEGPGQQFQGEQSTATSAYMERKRRKMASAYVSRFSSQVYNKMLPEAIESAQQSVDELSLVREQLAAENNALHNEVAVLERELENRDEMSLPFIKVEPEDEKAPDLFQPEVDTMLCGITDSVHAQEPPHLFEGGPSYWQMNFAPDVFAGQV